MQGHTTYKSYMDYTYLNSTYCTLARRSWTSDGAARTLQTLTGTARYASINAHKGGPKMDGFGVRDEGWGTRWRFHRFLVYVVVVFLGEKRYIFQWYFCGFSFPQKLLMKHGSPFATSSGHTLQQRSAVSTGNGRRYGTKPTRRFTGPRVCPLRCAGC